MSLWTEFEGVADLTPSRSALIASDGAFTYGALAEAAVAMDAHLRAGGIRPGDRVAYLGHNSAAVIVLLLAAARGGYMLVPLNWRLAPEELTWILRDADPQRLICADAMMETGRMIAGAVPLEQYQCLGQRAEDPPDAVGLALNDLLLVYTSGATGRPKGAVLTHAAMTENARLSWDMHAMSAHDRVFTTLPLFHVGGLNIQTVPALLCGAEVVLAARFDADACLNFLEEHRITLTVQVPTTLQALLEAPGWADADLSALRLIATGSTHVPVPLIEAVHTRGIPVIQIYGATETAPIVIYQREAEARSHIGSIGRAGPGVTVEVRDRDGNAHPNGTPGEIWLKSHTLTRGYWRNPSADRSAFDRGWFRTGDVAWRDDDGFFWFTDRIKNVIISGGENIFPAELEAVLKTLPDVADYAVVGRPDLRWGDVPVAVIVPSGANPDRAAILGAFEGRLARFKHPRDVVFVDAIPRNAMGKIETGRLREMVRETT